MSFKYPLATTSWDDAEKQAIMRVMDTGIYTMGKAVAEFERIFADYVGSQYCVMSNSGSSANLLMVAAMRYRRENSLQPGDEVIVPAVSWSTTYYPLYQYGLTMRFVDVDPKNFNMDLQKLAEAITPKTKAILAVNLLGNPNKFDEIQKIIGDRNIIILEDNCESLGATYKGQQAGAIGLMGSFSGFFSHHIATMEGGLTVTNDEELYHIMLALRAHGWTRNLPDPNHVTGKKHPNPFDEHFRFVLPGYNLRPLEMSGAIGIEQMKKLPNFIKERRENAVRFIEALGNQNTFIPQQEIGESSWFGFGMIINPESGIQRADVVAELTKHNIENRPIVAGNFAKNEVMRLMPHKIHGNLNGADLIDSNGFFVGNHHYKLSDEFTLLRNALNKFLV